MGVYACFRPHHTLCRTLVHLKDCTSFRRQAGVVYRIPCSSCETMYIGQTGRALDHRLKEHRRTRTPHNEQGWRPTTNSVQPSNPTSAPALLKTCCCFFIVLYFLIIIIIYCNLHCANPNLVLYTACLHFTHPLFSSITIISCQEWLFFPTFCVYKVTLPCIVDHNSLKRALDWAEMSEFV